MYKLILLICVGAIMGESRRSGVVKDFAAETTKLHLIYAKELMQSDKLTEVLIYNNEKSLVTEKVRDFMVQGVTDDGIPYLLTLMQGQIPCANTFIQLYRLTSGYKIRDGFVYLTK